MKWMALPRIIPATLLALMLLSGSALAEQRYNVRSGDTLSSIARQTGVTVTALKETNRLQGSKLKINQVLVIPSAGEKRKTANSSPQKENRFYTVRKGDTLSLISARTGVSVYDLGKINNLSSSRLKIGQQLALEKKQESPEITTASSEQIARPPAADKQDQNFETANNDLSLPSEMPAKNEPAAMDSPKGKLLGEWESPNEQQLLVKVALAFLDAPYRFGGSSVRGIDCSGFVKKIYSLFGVDLPRTAAEQSHVGIEVAKSSLTEGDLIFFVKKNRIGHVGIYIGNNKFVHAASSNKGVRVDSLDSSYYKNHYERAVRLKASEQLTKSKFLSSETSFAEAHRQNDGKRTYQ